jgi:hypothetical protein
MTLPRKARTSAPNPTAGIAPSRRAASEPRSRAVLESTVVSAAAAAAADHPTERQSGRDEVTVSFHDMLQPVNGGNGQGVVQ